MIGGVSHLVTIRPVMDPIKGICVTIRLCLLNAVTNSCLFVQTRHDHGNFDFFFCHSVCLRVVLFDCHFNPHLSSMSGIDLSSAN